MDPVIFDWEATKAAWLMRLLCHSREWSLTPRQRLTLLDEAEARFDALAKLMDGRIALPAVKDGE